MIKPYIIKTESYKGYEKLIWSDTHKNARIAKRTLGKKEFCFENRPQTIEEAIRVASIFIPRGYTSCERKPTTFLEPILHLKNKDPYFTVQYVKARR